MASAVAAYDPLATSGARQQAGAKVFVYTLLVIFAGYYLLPLAVIVLNTFATCPRSSAPG